MTASRIAAIAVVLATAGCLLGAEAPGKCTISIGQRTLNAKTHAIVLPDKPTDQEKHAAGEFTAHIAKLTGQTLPIVRDSKLVKATPIVVGRCTATLAKLGVKADLASLGLEGIIIKTKGPALVLAGNKRGVLYAVYTFLEDYCGCRWLTPDCTIIPKEGSFAIADLNIRYIPPLEYRATDYPCHRDADFAVRNKYNGTQTRIDEPRGGKIAYSHFVHTFNSILDPTTHFKDHPEYFSMVKSKRIGGRTQLCLTNPEVIAIAKKVVRGWIKAAPQATIFGVSQNDWHNYCRCDKCEAQAKKEESQAGPMIHFVNAIADDIAKDYPDKIISTLAYQYTRKPPKHVKPSPNVTVRLCSIECCFSHPLATCSYNRTFTDDIKGWSKICKRLSVWDYVVDYHNSVMPFPNLYSLKPNINFFVNNGVTSVYEEAAYFTPGTELAELRTWIMAKTLWNPNYNTDKAIDEFLAGYYGPAAGAIAKYIDLMHKQVKDNKDWHMVIWAKPTSPWLNADAIAQSVKLFDRAEASVKGNPTLMKRVRIARMPIQYTRIVTADRSKANPKTINALIDAFEAGAGESGLTMYREHRSYGDLKKWLTATRAKWAPKK
jgi:hypothetical protein